MNLLATNYFIATEAELPEIYAVYLEKLAEINANPGVTIVLLSDTEEPAEHQSVYEELLQKYAEIHSIGGKKLELYQLDTVVKLDGVTDAAQAHKLLTEFAPPMTVILACSAAKFLSNCRDQYCRRCRRRVRSLRALPQRPRYYCEQMCDLSPLLGLLPMP